jgi:hypothetical protein
MVYHTHTLPPSASSYYLLLTPTVLRLASDIINPRI